MDISLHSFTARDFCARGEQGILITSWHSFESALDEFHQSYGRFLPKVLPAQTPTVLSILSSGSSSTLFHANSPLESGSNYYLPGMISLVLSRCVECPICVWLFFSTYPLPRVLFKLERIAAQWKEFVLDCCANKFWFYTPRVIWGMCVIYL